MQMTIVHSVVLAAISFGIFAAAAPVGDRSVTHMGPVEISISHGGLAKRNNGGCRWSPNNNNNYNRLRNSHRRGGDNGGDDCDRERDYCGSCCSCGGCGGGCGDNCGGDPFSDNNNQNINQNVDTNQNINLHEMMEEDGKFGKMARGALKKRYFAEGCAGGVHGKVCDGPCADPVLPTKPAKPNFTSTDAFVNKNINYNKNVNEPITEIVPIEVIQTEYVPVIQPCGCGNFCDHLEVAVDYPCDCCGPVECVEGCGCDLCCDETPNDAQAISMPVVNNYITMGSTSAAIPQVDVSNDSGSLSDSGAASIPQTEICADNESGAGALALPATQVGTEAKSGAISDPITGASATPISDIRADAGAASLPQIDVSPISNVAADSTSGATAIPITNNAADAGSCSDAGAVAIPISNLAADSNSCADAGAAAIPISNLAADSNSCADAGAAAIPISNLAADSCADSGSAAVIV
ncbi:hypothetical protein FPQ18DRAFT_334964 [Pyronema domesticum]|uniref:Uncharacterized protein n=1 Tax=Pyronema omphalodes (strain CBS 100304) TaxID=1076935 RepID=U4KZL3_PYROM|nr:hypothetical protein FPQ18DRAFT_334964 [Pyronema domesticum]CCX05139.1 Protein of unknown function [Pyronema omphalodes CBS 100304]